MVTQITKYDKSYETPVGLTEDKYYEFMHEFIDLAKVKGLTVRQAQKLFIDCSNAILDTKLNEEYYNNDYLKSIVESLGKIAYKGIDTFERCSSTNNN